MKTTNTEDLFALYQVDVDGTLFTALSSSHGGEVGDIVRIDVWGSGTLFGTVVAAKRYATADEVAWEMRKGTVYVVKGIWQKYYINQDDSKDTYEGEEQENEQ